MLSPARQSFFWSLRVIVAMSLIAPAVLFLYAAFDNYRALDAQADERIQRALDVQQEQALKALQTVEVSIAEINETMRGVSDPEIRAREEEFHRRFARSHQATPQIASIWAFDRDGHPLASSTIFPVPPRLDNSDRSYFAAQKERDAGPFIGEVLKARVGPATFFVVSGRRSSEPPGQFNGVIGVTLPPAHFIEFYRKLSRGHDSFALVRTDGTLLARYPDTELDRNVKLSALLGAFDRGPEAGLFTTVSRIDGIERRVGYRKVPGYPLFVATTIETGAIASQFRTVMLSYLAVGLPATLALFALALYALRRAQRFQQEVARRELAEAALKQAQRLEAVGQLTGGVAHDFNNLLMVVSGNTDLLKRALPVNEKAKRAIEALEIAVKRGSALTRALLSFSRRQTHEARPVDLAVRLPALQPVLHSSLRGDVAIETDVPAGLWPIKVDNGEFELALLNLAVNARDAMEEGGTLTLSARNVTLTAADDLELEGEFVALAVRDTGSGIAPDVLPKVFEPFFTTKEVGKGTGLGLSQVYGFARQAGGTARVESELGRGTTVTLYLPRSRDPAEPEAQPAPAPALPLAEPNVHVLLVEDNPDVADVARRLLEEHGYVVLQSGDVPAARGRLQGRQDRIDIVLSDIVMPGGPNGLDLARWIRTEYGERLPVVLATGYSDQAQAAANEGFALLRKPYDAASLHRTLSEALRRARDRKVA
jgi:two-component system NtrC family sensor kinase